MTLMTHGDIDKLRKQVADLQAKLEEREALLKSEKEDSDEFERLNDKAQAELQRLRTENETHKMCLESWKKEEQLWKEREQAFILKEQQMQAGAEILIEENAALKAKLETVTENVTANMMRAEYHKELAANEAEVQRLRTENAELERRKQMSIEYADKINRENAALRKSAESQKEMIEELTEENAVLKRPVTDEEWLAIKNNKAYYWRVAIDEFLASRTQEAQKGEDTK